MTRNARTFERKGCLDYGSRQVAFFTRAFSSHNTIDLHHPRNSGIGLEASILFAKEGAQVVCADINEQTGAATVQKIYETLGYTPDSPTPKPAIFVRVDVSKETDIENAVKVAEKEFGKLNIVFNNAGIMHPADDDAINTEEKIWDLTIQINVKGVWWGCKHAIPALRRAGGGSIINTASFVALRGAATPQLACA